MGNFDITVGSFPDKENLVADIFYENIQVAEITNENNNLQIQIYCYKDKDYWEFSLDEFQKVIEKAKQKLIAIG